MALTFCSLLFMQITYIENMVKMRNEQFSEAVKRSLYAVSSQLEQDETKRYLAEDIEENQKRLLQLTAEAAVFASADCIPMSRYLSPFLSPDHTISVRQLFPVSFLHVFFLLSPPPSFFHTASKISKRLYTPSDKA